MYKTIEEYIASFPEEAQVMLRNYLNTNTAGSRFNFFATGRFLMI